ncbi:MAG: nucleotidyltransferase family protein [Clostridia bacterium]|nr:nucleotidyltransferase family protein [Clostridia bacterium]
MKICFAICEYNPFHNGHLKHIEYIKQNLGADAIVVILSGNFTERGDIAVLDKYTRATHAIKAGADMVIELPAVFATANAEIFAKGAVKLINAVECEKALCFGTESGDIKEIITASNLSLNESEEFKRELLKQLKSGVSYAKARATTIEKVEGLNKKIISTPNNILAIEYVKAIKQCDSDIEVYTLKRQGGAFNSSELCEGASSALAIRTAIENGNIKDIESSVPPFVYSDLPTHLPSVNELVLQSVLNAKIDFLSAVQDCTEGLENAVKKHAKTALTLDELVKKIKSKRYTETRIKRILINCLLGIDKHLIKDSLNSDLYFKVLAINSSKLDLLKVLSNSAYPLITRKGDEINLTATALKCFEKDCYANSVYQIATRTKLNDYEMKKV